MNCDLTSIRNLRSVAPLVAEMLCRIPLVTGALLSAARFENRYCIIVGRAVIRCVQQAKIKWPVCPPLSYSVYILAKFLST